MQLIKVRLIIPLPPKRPKQQPSASFNPKKFLSYYTLFKKETNTATQENKQQYSIDKELEAGVKSNLALKKLPSNKLVELEQNTNILPALQRNIFLHNNLL